MEILGIEGVRIAGIAAYVPKGAVANDAKAAAATGIPARRVAPPGASALDLCLAAARRVLADTGSRPDDFGAVLAVSFTQRERMPSLAAQAQARLGLPTAVLAFDLLQACAGWPYGLYLACLLARETGKKVLLLDGDRQSDFLDADDPATAPLLSDGATATVVEGAGGEGGASGGIGDAALPVDGGRDALRRVRGDQKPASFSFAFLTDGGKGGALRLEKGGTIRMDGFGVFRFVAIDVVAFLKEFVGQVAEPPDFSTSPPFHSSTFFVPHQPNVYMVRQLAKALGLEGRTLVSADRFGNLASASVPATVAAHAAAFAGKAARLLVCGFGGGLAISAARIALDPDCRLSVTEE